MFRGIRRFYTFSMDEDQPHTTRQSPRLSPPKIHWLIQHSYWLALSFGLPLVVAAYFAPASIPYLIANGTVGVIGFLVLVLAWRLRSYAMHLGGLFLVGPFLLSRVDHAFPAQPGFSFVVAIAAPFFVMCLLCTVLRSAVFRFARIPNERSA